LFSIAVTFNSPRYEAGADRLWQLLRTAEVIEANGISSVLTISQDGVSVQVEEAVGDLHLDDNDPSALKIYVPMDRAAQGFCFSSPLPNALAEWLMKDPVTNICRPYDENLVTALRALLPIEIAAVDRCLDYHGIIQLKIPGDGSLEAPTVDDESALEPVEDVSTLPQRSGNP